MNTTALKTLYIILGAGALALAAGPAAAQAGLGPVNRTIDRTLEQRLPRLDDRLDAELRRKAEAAERAAQQAEQAAQELPVDGLADPEALTSTVDDIGNTVTSGVAGVAQDAAVNIRPFVVDVDPFGNPIESNTLVVLVDRGQVAAVRAHGLTVIGERDMPGLGLVLLTLRAPQGYGLAEKALELEVAFPDAAVDFNHLYFFQSDTAAAEQTEAAEAQSLEALQDAPSNGRSQNESSAAGKPGAETALRIGLIDSAVLPEHESLQDAAVTARDFVTHDAERPVGHGTAVASVIARASAAPVSIYAAAVFFQTPGHAPGASTESLIGALDWLAAEQVDAINMSLAGPANTLLEQALLRLAAVGGPAVIAAVGNNGPSGDPLYPAAYDVVVGVTAIDRDRKVFRYANRGDHVDFAALGVDVKVANAGGGWRLESGTSMAAPRVAVVVAALRRENALRGDELRALLISNAHDLGRPGFDPVFGYGLLAGPPELVSRIKTLPQD